MDSITLREVAICQRIVYGRKDRKIKILDPITNRERNLTHLERKIFLKYRRHLAKRQKELLYKLNTYSILWIIGIVLSILFIPYTYDFLHSFNIHQWQYWAIYDLHHPSSIWHIITGIDK